MNATHKLFKVARDEYFRAVLTTNNHSRAVEQARLCAQYANSMSYQGTDRANAVWKRKAEDWAAIARVHEGER